LAYLCLIFIVHYILFCFQQITLQEGVAQLDKAFDEYGINFLDTVEIYPAPIKAKTQGSTAKILAQFLKGVDGKMAFGHQSDGDERIISRGFLVVRKIQ
jgi:hypothetical protein